MNHGTAVVVTPAERDALFEWWTQYGESDHAHASFTRYASMKRRVLWREPGKGIEYVDEGRALGFELKARTLAEFHAPERVSAKSESNLGGLDSEYWFERLPAGGTRLTATATYHGAPGGVLARIASDSLLSTLLGYDLRAHVREYEREAMLS